MKKLLTRTNQLQAWKEELASNDLAKAETQAALDRNALVLERLDASLAPDRDTLATQAQARQAEYQARLTSLTNRGIILRCRLKAHELAESKKSLPRRLINACLAAKQAPSRCLDRGIGRLPEWKLALQTALTDRDIRAAARATQMALDTECPLWDELPDWLTSLQGILRELKTMN